MMRMQRKCCKVSLDSSRKSSKKSTNNSRTRYAMPFGLCKHEIMSSVGLDYICLCDDTGVLEFV